MMGRRLSAVLLCLMMLLALPACGTSDPGESTAEPTPTPASSGEPTASVTDPTGTAPAVSLQPMQLPEAFTENGWALVGILPDGRWVLNSTRRLSIVDLDSGAETVICEAEFGIQAACNDRYIAYGIGGDEYLDVHLYTVSTGVDTVVLHDAQGYLDLELTRSDALLVSRIRYTGIEAVLDAWIRYDIRSRTSTVIPSSERAYALYLFHQRYPDLPTTWTYDIGQTWREAWVDAQEQLFYAAFTRTGRNEYSTRILQSVASDTDRVLYEQEDRALPDIRIAGGLVVIDRTQAFRTDTAEPVPVPDLLPAEDFPYGAAAAAWWRNHLLIAAVDRYGRMTTVYRVENGA